MLFQLAISKVISINHKEKINNVPDHIPQCGLLWLHSSNKSSGISGELTALSSAIEMTISTDRGLRVGTARAVQARVRARKKGRSTLLEGFLGRR